MKSGNFYGPSGGGLTVPNNVDISQRTAEGPGPGGDWAEITMRDMRRMHPYWPEWNDPAFVKRFVDGLRDNLAGRGTTEKDDALLRQETPEEKPFSSDEFWNSEEPKRVMPRKL